MSFFGVRNLRFLHYQREFEGFALPNIAAGRRRARSGVAFAPGSRLGRAARRRGRLDGRRRAARPPQRAPAVAHLLAAPRLEAREAVPVGVALLHVARRVVGGDEGSDLLHRPHHREIHHTHPHHATLTPTDLKKWKSPKSSRKPGGAPKKPKRRGRSRSFLPLNFYTHTRRATKWCPTSVAAFGYGAARRRARKRGSANAGPAGGQRAGAASGRRAGEVRVGSWRRREGGEVHARELELRAWRGGRGKRREKGGGGGKAVVLPLIRRRRFERDTGDSDAAMGS